MNTNVQNPPPSAAAVPTAVDRHLLTTVGTAPGVATRTDIMHAVAQIAREQLSERWVKGDSAATVPPRPAACTTCRWNS